MRRRINWKKARKHPRFQMQLLTAPIETYSAAMRTDCLSSIDRMTTHSVDMSKWLLASLLALNSGGLFALLANLPRIGQPVLTGACFCLGIAGSLLNAWLIQWFGMRNLNWVYDAARYWLICETTGNRWLRSERIIWKNAIRTQKAGRWVALPGWLSTLFFFAGAIIGATSLHLT